ncbi:MAG: lycopene cyclase domain-containing protein [Actinomycetes bacterium]
MTFAYLGVLGLCLLATLPLELWLGVRVYARWRRFALSLLPVVPVFVAWDAYAIAHGHWRFDRDQTLGVRMPGGIPVEEILFFCVVPLCAVMTLEAVRVVRGWRVGDERTSAR